MHTILYKQIFVETSMLNYFRRSYKLDHYSNVISESKVFLQDKKIGSNANETDFIQQEDKRFDPKTNAFSFSSRFEIKNFLLLLIA